MKKIKYIDVCSGIGITRLSLERNHWECVGRFETDLVAEEIYKSLYNPKERNFGDVTRLPLSLPEFDVLVASIPGSTFSRINRNTSRPDSSIPFALVELLYRYRPQAFLIESVSGFSDRQSNPCFPLFISNLESMGYTIAYRTDSADDYGLPILTKRFLLVGSLNGLPSIFVGIDHPNVSLENSLIDRKNQVLNTATAEWKTYLRKSKVSPTWNVYDEPDFTIIDRRQTDLRLYRNVCPSLRKGNHGLYYLKEGQVKKITAYEGLMLHGVDRFYAWQISKHPVTEYALMSYVAASVLVPMIELVSKWLELTILMTFTKAA